MPRFGEIMFQSDVFIQVVLVHFNGIFVSHCIHSSY